MRKYLSILFFIAISSNAQVTNSVLASGDWFKFSTDTTGVFKIDKSFLSQIGITTSGLNPKKIHIYGNGGCLLPALNSDFREDDLQENAIFIQGEADGVFDDDDFILFYAKGPHDWIVNATANTATHRQNIYSDKAYYFITVNEIDGKRIQSAPAISGTPVTQITTFDDFTFYEKETTNIIAAGNQWFGESFSFENVQNFTIPFKNAVPNSPVSVTVRAAVQSSLSSSFTVSANSESLFTLVLGGIPIGSLEQAFATQKTGSFSNSSDQITVSISYNNGGLPSAKSYLDYIEIIGKKQLTVNDFQFSFRSFTAATTSGIVQYQLENASNILQLWDVTDFLSPKLISNQAANGVYSFQANGEVLREYVVVTSSDFYIPETMEDAKVVNQNLHAVKDVNYIIITNAELASQAKRLTDYHQKNSNLTTKVILLDEIYNEFGSGSKDITAIRDFIKHVYQTNTSENTQLKYVCFFGDASYDYKDRISGNNNIVPVYESFNSFNLATSFVTDDYFAMLEANEGSMNRQHTLDVATGRIPVDNIQQASILVDKMLRYYHSNSKGDWRNTITLLADDIDATSDIQIQSGVEEIADDIKINKPIFNVNKIYADSFVQENSSGGERYPGVKTAITNAIETGTLVFDYFGHGGEDGFAAERILEKTQIQNLNNPNTLPLLITVTCDFSRFDNPNRITAGELIFWNADGGAASMITTTREVYINVGQLFNEQLIKVLLEFNNEDLTIAESLAKTKNEFTNSNQKFFIFYFGDPAMKLAIPEPNVRITKINGTLISQSLDTLKALSKVRFEGIVTNSANSVLTDFNGTLSTTVFDKPIDKKTLDNDGAGVEITFDSQESKLFRGKSSVENGVFNFEFVVPKDIKVAYGKGKLSFYAENSAIDKSGYNLDVVVGGIDENAPNDSEGPEINVFLNDTSFMNGSNTNSSPNLILNLSDISGINTSITAVDHDIVAILDGDTSNPIILNDFYETELNDFTKGVVNYTLRDLDLGNHTLKVKAWDTYNNSSEATLNFVVISDTLLQLENVLNYPNPFINYTEFWFTHNKPNEPLEVQVQIFTVSGKLVKTINQNVQTTGSLSRNIIWNGLDDFGSKIGKGVYVYKLSVKSISDNLISEKYEKLVILQ